MDDMMGKLITVAITSSVTLFVCMINNYYTNKREEAVRRASQQDLITRQEEALMVIKVQIENLDKKVEKHNNVIDRTYKLEQATSIIAEQMKVANHRISDLEKSKEA